MQSFNGRSLVETSFSREPLISGSISSINQVVEIDIPAGMSSWTVQTTGTFVGNLIAELTINGVDYVPINARQSLAGRLANNWSSPGLFRGTLGGGTKFRVRARTWTSGTANIWIAAGAGGAANFQNSIVEVRMLEQYYASVSGENVAFSGSVGAVTIGTTGGLVAILNNPSNAATDAFIARVVVGTNRPGRFERWRVAANPTITGAFTPMTNKGGGTNVSTAKMYMPNAASITGGILSKTVFINGNSSDDTVEDGASILRPGQSLYWIYTPDTNQTALATVTLSFWESISVT